MSRSKMARCKMAESKIHYPTPLVRWDGQRHTFREFHENIFKVLMNPDSNFFLGDDNKKYLPMGLRFHPKSDELLVLGRRSDLFILSFAIKDNCFFRLADPDVNIRNATKLPYRSNYYDLATTGELGFDEIETTQDSLCRAVMNLLGNMKKSKEAKKESEKDTLYLAFKSDIMTLCFCIAEAVRFRPVYLDSFGNDGGPSVRVSGWSTLLPNYWQKATKKSHLYQATTISHYIPMDKSGANFFQTLEDIKLVSDLTQEELDLINGERRDDEVYWIPALMRLLDCPKACDFVVKLKWMFTEVEELEGKIVGAFSSKIPVMSAADIKKKLQYNRESSQLEWVLRQLVKRGILDVNDNLYNVISRG